MDYASDMTTHFLSIQTDELQDFDPEKAQQEGKLTPSQIMMLQEMIENFDPDKSECDKAILYEITGQQYQGDSLGDDLFYESYADYERSDTKLALSPTGSKVVIPSSSQIQ